MHIKHILVCLLVLFLVKSRNEDTMTWDESRRLTWNDFKADPNQNSDAVALTASGITFGYSLKTSGKRIIDFTTSVEANFYPNKSWYLKEKGNSYILAHEQLHFDITELYARMFRQQIKKLVVNQNLKEQLKRLHKSINKALGEAQKSYDAQSNHSINMDAQKQWSALITEELIKFEAYKS